MIHLPPSWFDPQAPMRELVVLQSATMVLNDFRSISIYHKVILLYDMFHYWWFTVVGVPNPNNICKWLGQLWKMSKQFWHL